MAHICFDGDVWYIAEEDQKEKAEKLFFPRIFFTPKYLTQKFHEVKFVLPNNFVYPKRFATPNFFFTLNINLSKKFFLTCKSKL